MTVSSAIARACAVYTELSSDDRVYAWLSELEERVCLGMNAESFVPIGISDGARELSAPGYLSEIYPLYIVLKYDISNADHNRYICHNAAFLAAYAELSKHFSRNGNFKSDTPYKLL